MTATISAPTGTMTAGINYKLDAVWWIGGQGREARPFFYLEWRAWRWFYFPPAREERKLLSFPGVRGRKGIA